MVDEKDNFVYVPGTYISPFVVALQVCNHFVFFKDSSRLNSSAVNIITGISQSKGQKWKQPRTTAAIDVRSIAV